VDIRKPSQFRFGERPHLENDAIGLSKIYGLAEISHGGLVFTYAVVRGAPGGRGAADCHQTAKLLGIEMPETLLATADELIK
jgi:hypothetical protein